MKLSTKDRMRLAAIGAKGVARAEDQQYYEELTAALARIQRDMLNAHVKSLGMENANRRYTSDEKLDLLLYVFDYLVQGQFPDFEEISAEMKRTPSALAAQAQKLLCEGDISQDYVMSYGLSEYDAKRLLAPQHGKRAKFRPVQQ